MRVELNELSDLLPIDDLFLLVAEAVCRDMGIDESWAEHVNTIYLATPMHELYPFVDADDDREYVLIPKNEMIRVAREHLAAL